MNSQGFIKSKRGKIFPQNVSVVLRKSSCWEIAIKTKKGGALVLASQGFNLTLMAVSPWGAWTEEKSPMLVQKKTCGGLASAQPDMEFAVDHICLYQLLLVCVYSPRITAVIFTLQQLPSWDLRIARQCRLGLLSFLQERACLAERPENATVLREPSGVERGTNQFGVRPAFLI